MQNATVSVKKLHEKAKLPVYGSDLAAGADLFAILDAPTVTVMPSTTVAIHTGLAMAIPKGYVGLVFARSGLACKRGVAPANKVGVIDADYRGEIIVALHNHGSAPVVLEDGERIAQMVIAPCLMPAFLEADTLDDTVRGEGGFGSSGRK